MDESPCMRGAIAQEKPSLEDSLDGYISRYMDTENEISQPEKLLIPQSPEHATVSVPPANEDNHLDCLKRELQYQKTSK